MTSQPKKPAVPKALKGMSILIVDDQFDNLAIAEAAIEFHGGEVCTASNGEEGMALLGTGQKFDVVLLDLSMPRMDGWEMIRRVRAQPERRTMPVIALTAHAMEGDRERALASGFDGYIPKPFDVMTLALEVQAILSTISHPPKQPQSDPNAAQPPNSSDVSNLSPSKPQEVTQ